jgi:hypothetical protein
MSYIRNFFHDSIDSQRRKSQRRRRNTPNDFTFYSLESRQLLATIIADFGSGVTLDWTEGSSWIGGTVPGANDRAVIPQNTTVQLDGTNHTVKELVVMGTLDVPEVSGVDRSLTSNWIHVNSGGVFQIGTAADRYDTAEFTLTLTGTDPTQTFSVETAMGNITINNNDSFLMAAGGGRLQFFGQEKLSFSKLGATVNAGSSQIIVENIIERNYDGTTSAASDGQLDWEVGDQIVIASSSEDYNDQEVRNIAAIIDLGNGTSRITLNSSLNHRHSGEIETYRNDTRTWDLDLRAEVALLNRNVKITSESWHDTDNQFGDRARFTQALGNPGDGFGGHIMIMPTAGQITVDGVQLDQLGQTARVGRYPIHWHLSGDNTGDVLRQTSITNSNNRGVTLHGAHNVLVQDVVLHDIHGHGFFMEDAVETGNQYISNIALGIHAVGQSNNSINLNDPFIVDTHDHVGQNASRFLSSAAYWMTNPDNTWIGNISAGSEGTGFWFIFPGEAIGESANDPQYSNVRPDRTNLRQFDHNSAHSSPAGLNFDRGSDLEVPVGATLKPNFAGDAWLPSEEPQINNFTAYKHNVAIYHRGFDANFHDNRIADSNIGTFITFTQRITDTLYVGHSRGNADFSDSVTGHTIYDGANTLDGIHFAGFAASNAHTFRTNGSALRHTSHVMTNTSFENDGSAGHVSVGTQGGGSSQNSPFDLSPASIYDADGTLTGHVGGGAGWTVVTNHPFFYDDDDIVPTGWNAAISDDIYAMLNFDPNNDSSRFRATAPDGDQIVDAGTSRRNTHIKIGNIMDPDDDYRIDLSSGSYSNSFDFRYWIRTGPSGPSVIRFENFGNTLRPQNLASVNSLDDLRTATESSYTVFDGDVYIKAFSSSSDIRMRSFTSANPIAADDQAMSNGASVNIDVLSNDRDNDGDVLSIVAVGDSASADGTVVADYRDDFETDTAPDGWQYLWNSGGEFGTPSNYSPLVFENWRYRPAGSELQPYLTAQSAHPGDGTGEGPGIERHAIAAFTVTQDGEYSITDSLISNNNSGSDGVNVKVHVTGGSVTTLETIGTNGAGNFDTSLGFLTAGQIVYVGVGPRANNGADSSNFDFTIRRSEPSSSANGTVQINSDNTITYTPNPGFSGNDTFTYEVSDGRGGSDTATVSINVDQPAFPPTVVSVVRDGGDESRPDVWSTLQIEFDSDVNVFSFSLAMANDSEGGTDVSLTGVQFDYDSTNFIATWNFENLNTPMEAGFYTYRLSGMAVGGTDGQFFLDGDGDGNEGGDLVGQQYVAIPGDANLDGTVNVLGDGFVLVGNLGTTGATTWAQGDFNADGTINVLGDGFPLVGNLGRNVNPTASLAPALTPISQDSHWTGSNTRSQSTPVNPVPVSSTADADRKKPDAKIKPASLFVVGEPGHLLILQGPSEESVKVTTEDVPTSNGPAQVEGLDEFFASDDQAISI